MTATAPGTDTATSTARADVIIAGGGIAGLWLASLLRSRGYASVLLEAGELGGQQTLASQGMIHGGLKYALSGALTGASEAIAGMPERWRRCLEGRGDVNLTGLEPLSDRYYLFAERSTLGRLTTFFASRTLRGRIARVDRVDYPAALADPGFDGVVYALDDFVLDTRALVCALHAASADAVYRQRLDGAAVTVADDGVRVSLGDQVLWARHLVVTAGAGARALLDGLGMTTPRMQLRPLQQVLVRHRCLHPLYAHCLTGIRRPEPRLTITSHRDGDGWLWYVGGQLASDGAAMSSDALVQHACRELATCLPWMDWQQADISTLRVDRAEPAEEGGRRPDRAFAQATGPCIVAWPTKLSLVPDLGDRVLALLTPPAGMPTPALNLPPARVGRPPWDH